MKINELVETFNTILSGEKLYDGSETIAISNTLNGICKENLVVIRNEKNHEIQIKVDKELGGTLTFNDLIEKLQKQPHNVTDYKLKFCYLEHNFDTEQLYPYTYKGENIVALSKNDTDLSAPALGVPGDRELNDSQVLSVDDMLY